MIGCAIKDGLCSIVSQRIYTKAAIHAAVGERQLMGCEQAFKIRSGQMFGGGNVFSSYGMRCTDAIPSIRSIVLLVLVQQIRQWGGASGQMGEI